MDKCPHCNKEIEINGDGYYACQYCNETFEIKDNICKLLYTCPCCNREIEIGENKGEYQCPYCQSVFAVSGSVLPTKDKSKKFYNEEPMYIRQATTRNNGTENTLSKYWIIACIVSFITAIVIWLNLMFNDYGSFSYIGFFFGLIPAVCGGIVAGLLWPLIAIVILISLVYSL